MPTSSWSPGEQSRCRPKTSYCKRRPREPCARCGTPSAMIYTACDILTQHGSSPSDASRKIAIVDGARRISYAELLEQSSSLAARLQAAGVKRGDRVAIFLRRSIEAVAALFATHLAGGV